MEGIKESRKFAYEVLSAHRLWRKGFCAEFVFSAAELSGALDIATEALSSLEGLEADLKMQNLVALSATRFAQEERAENRRLRALLAAHKIKYKKEN